MKKMKKLASLVLALAMALTLAVPALAAGTGKITIENTVAEETYTIYQILDLESYNVDSGAYAYKANSAWVDWLKTQVSYVKVDAQEYVTWVEDADKAKFAEDALAYAKETGITNSGSTEATGTTVVFSGLDLGYYLVETSLGALCGLTTTNPEATVIEKNSGPTLEKEVKEDSTEGWGSVNDAEFNQEVEFKATITVVGYAKDYVMHDTMSAGLDYEEVTLVTLNGVEVASVNNYTVETDDECTFDVVFTDSFCENLKSGDVIQVFYKATLNENAAVGGTGNPNEAKLSYTDYNNVTQNTTPDRTITYTWNMEVLKYANGDETQKLEGVKFVLLNDKATMVALFESGKLSGWEEIPEKVDGAIPWSESAVLTTDGNGKIAIEGLDAGTYKLRETKALEGYNKLSEDKVVTITSTVAEDGMTMSYTRVVEKINNNSGSELPSTGGMGTTLFYALGAVLVIGAGVAMVTKKRMA